MNCPNCGSAIGKEKMCSYCGYSSHKAHNTSAQKAQIATEITAQPAASTPANFEKELSGTIKTSSNPSLSPNEYQRSKPDHDRCETSIRPIYWVFMFAILAAITWVIITIT